MAAATLATIDFFKIGIAQFLGHAGFGQYLLGVAVGVGCVVLMNTTEQDALAARVRGLGQLGAPQIVGVVTNLAPIDRENDDGFAGAGEHDATGL